MSATAKLQRMPVNEKTCDKHAFTLPETAELHDSGVVADVGLIIDWMCAPSGMRAACRGPDHCSAPGGKNCKAPTSVRVSIHKGTVKISMGAAF